MVPVSLAMLLLAAGCDGAQARSSQGPASTTAAAALAYQPKAGQEQVYALRSAGTLAVDYARWSESLGPRSKTQPRDPSKAPLREHVFEVKAELHTRVLGRVEEAWMVAMRLQKVAYTVDGETEGRSRLLEWPFVGWLSPRGELRLQFPKGFPEEVAGMISGLVEPLQVVFADDGAAGSWTAKQRSSQGSSSVEYRLRARGSEAITLERTTRSLLPRGLEALAAGQPGIATRVEKSGGTVEWATDGSGLIRVAYSDSTASSAGRATFAKQNESYSAERAASGALAELPRSVESASAALSDLEAARLAYYSVSSQARNKLQELTTEQVWQYFMEHVDQDMSNAAFLLKHYLRKNPGAVREIADRLNRLEPTRENLHRVGRGFAVMGATGHFEAQQMLADIISGKAGYSRMCRDRALRATLSIEIPYAFLPPVIWAYREGLPRSGKLWKQARSIATNIYGAAGGLQKGVKENTKEVVRVLGERLQSTSDRNEKLMMLTALGNAGDLKAVLPLTEPYFASKDADLRRRAFHTFQKATGEEAFLMFAKRYAAEADATVRRTASDVAMAMPDSRARNAWAAEQVLTERDEIIAARQVRILGEELSRHPENDPVLRKLASTTENRNVLRTVYRYIAPTPAGGAL